VLFRDFRGSFFGIRIEWGIVRGRGAVLRGPLIYRFTDWGGGLSGVFPVSYRIVNKSG
jgi:hypothetical protein